MTNCVAFSSRIFCNAVKSKSKMVLNGVFLVALLWFDNMIPSNAAVHCYCNSPRCAGSSYMCLSKYGCFSDLVGESQSVNGASPRMHGCVDEIAMVEKCLTAEEIAYQRLNQSLHRKEEVTISSPSLSCCYEDMCNYAKYPGNDEDTSHDLDGTDDDRHMEFDSLNSRAVWFRAAVIAVPVAGFCILILLAMLASHLLSSDISKQTFSRLNEQRPAPVSKRNSHHHHRHIVKQPHMARHVKTSERQDYRTSQGAFRETFYRDSLPNGACKVAFNEPDKMTALSQTNIRACAKENCYTYLPSRPPIRNVTQKESTVTIDATCEHSGKVQIV